MTYRRLPYEEYFINTSEDYTHTGRASYAVKYVAVKYNTTRMGKLVGVAHEVNYEIHYEPDRDVIQIHFQRTFGAIDWVANVFEFGSRYYRAIGDHPYFDMHAPLLTKKELRTILAQGPRKTGPQVIPEVKNELGTAHAPATQKKRTLAEALRDASFVPSFRRAVVLGLLSLLLILFMTLTVPGRAFAEELYSLIVEFINGSLNAYSINPTPENDESSASLSLLPNDLQIPSELSGLIDHPVYISDDTVVSFFYNPHNSSGIVIKTIYETNDGVRYTIYQKIYNPNAHFGSDTEIDSSLMEFDSNLGFTMYAGTSDDGISLAVGFQEQCVIRVTSENLSVPEIIDVANSIYPV